MDVTLSVTTTFSHHVDVISSHLSVPTGLEAWGAIQCQRGLGESGDRYLNMRQWTSSVIHYQTSRLAEEAVSMSHTWVTISYPWFRGMYLMRRESVADLMPQGRYHHCSYSVHMYFPQ